MDNDNLSHQFENANITRDPPHEKNPYILFPRKIINDETLSFDALGLMVFIESQPDTYQITPQNLVKRFKRETEKNIKKYLDELIAAGYLQVNNH